MIKFSDKNWLFTCMLYIHLFQKTADLIVLLIVPSLSLDSVVTAAICRLVMFMCFQLNQQVSLLLLCSIVPLGETS